MYLFRSEAMQLVQLIIPMESAHLTVSYIGDLGLIQFKDVRTRFLSLSLLLSLWIFILLADFRLGQTLAWFCLHMSIICN
jgi:hypothetical protein